MYAIEAEGLEKEYRIGLLSKRRVKALRGVSLRIQKGTLYSLLGPNGAGKTTLVKILATLLIPDAGWARVAGFDVAREAVEVRKRVGVVLGGERALYWRLTGWSNLWFFSQLYGIPPSEARRRIRELIELVGLQGWEHVRVENYSKGMKQRLHIARGLLNDPEVLLLDEPTIGLDPAAAREVRRLIRRIVAEGRTVLLTTHYMGEAEELSDRIGIISKGRIIAEGSPGEVKKIIGGRMVLVSLTGPPGEASRLASLLGARARSIDGVTTIEAVVEDEEEFIDKVLGEALRRGLRVRRVEVREPSLEEAFIKLTGGSQ